MSAPGWWFVLDVEDVGRVVACAPPKCGLTSFQLGLVPGLARVAAEFGDEFDAGRAAFAFARGRGTGPYSAAEVLRGFLRFPRLLAVRDPVERFVSLWRDKADPDLADDPVFGTIAGASFVELLEYVEAYPMGDLHWAPQSAFLMPGAQPVPFHLFNEVLGLPRVHANRGRGVNPPDDVGALADRIRAHYAGDVALWERALRFDGRIR